MVFCVSLVNTSRCGSIFENSPISNFNQRSDGNLENSRPYSQFDSMEELKLNPLRTWSAVFSELEITAFEFLANCLYANVLRKSVIILSNRCYYIYYRFITS